jgi:hypothetical protein
MKNDKRPNTSTQREVIDREFRKAVIADRESDKKKQKQKTEK